MKGNVVLWIVLACFPLGGLQLAGSLAGTGRKISLSSPPSVRASKMVSQRFLERTSMHLRGGGLFSLSANNAAVATAAKIAQESEEEQRKEELMKGLECPTCFSLLFQPITLMCGHSFCGVCIKCWLRTLPAGSRICPLCRSPAEGYLGDLRTSYALTSTIRTLFPDLYAQRRCETQDALYFPPKNAPLLPILVRGETLYPGASFLLVLSRSDAMYAVLQAAYTNQTRLLYVGSGAEEHSCATLHVNDVAVEVEVLMTQEQWLSSAPSAPSSDAEPDQIMAQVRAHSRVQLTTLEHTSGPRGDMYAGRGIRFYDDVEDESAVVYKLAQRIRGKLPYFLANVMVAQQPPHDPEALADFVFFFVGIVLNFPIELHSRFLKMQSTLQRLEELAELLSRLACPRIQKGTLLLSSTPKSDFSFGGSVVLIYRHDPYGTEGVIINQDIGPLEEYLYPNGSEFLARPPPCGMPSLRFGGPVNLGSGAPYTQVLSRGRHLNTSHILLPDEYTHAQRYTGTPALLEGDGPNISHLLDSRGVLQLVDEEVGVGGVLLFRPRPVYCAAGRAEHGERQEEHIALQLTNDEHDSFDSEGRMEVEDEQGEGEEGEEGEEDEEDEGGGGGEEEWELAGSHPRAGRDGREAEERVGEAEEDINIWRRISHANSGVACGNLSDGGGGAGARGGGGETPTAAAQVCRKDDSNIEEPGAGEYSGAGVEEEGGGRRSTSRATRASVEAGECGVGSAAAPALDSLAGMQAARLEMRAEVSEGPVAPWEATGGGGRESSSFSPPSHRSVGVGERAETGRNTKKSKNVQSEVNVSAGELGEKNDGEGVRRREEDQELLVHGFASWCPHQLDREIRAGGWYIVKGLVNASVVFDWPHQEMYERLRGEAELMPFDANSFLEWASSRQIRVPSTNAK